jgi:hypothetical protein
MEMSLSEMKDGLYLNIPDEAYFADKSRVSCSTLKKLLKGKGATAALFKEDTITEAMRFGTAFHTITLEPDKFFDRFVVIPDVDFRSKDGKAVKESLSDCVMLNETGRTSDENRKIVLRQPDLDKLAAMRDGLLFDVNGNETLAKQLLDTCLQKEFVILFTHNGVPCKAKLDGLTVNYEIIDLKTCGSVEPDEFESTVFNYLYDIQAMFYKMAIRYLMDDLGVEKELQPEFYFLAVEKTENQYLSQVYKTDQWDSTAKQIIDTWLPICYDAMKTGQKTTYHGLDQSKSEQVAMRDWHSRKREELLTGRN